MAYGSKGFEGGGGWGQSQFQKEPQGSQGESQKLQDFLANYAEGAF